MPKVGKEDYSYNEEGMMEAAQESIKTGMPIQDASQRSTQTYAGGGMTGYNVPMYKDGGKAKMYKNGGKAKTMEVKYNKPKMSEKERLAGLEKLGKLAKAKKSKMKKTGKKKITKTLAEKEGLRHGSGELPPDSGRE